MHYARVSFIVLVFLCSFERCGQQQSEDAYPQQKKDSLVTVSISVTGDIMCHSVQYNYARVSADSFDFNPVFSEIKKYLDQSDFVFGNLETVTAGRGKGYSGYPLFNTPDAFISSLKNAGFDLLTTANNHAIDRGETGIKRTIEQLKHNHLDYTGTFLSERDRDSVRIYDVQGIKIGFFGYTYGTNGNPVPKGKGYLVNLIDTLKIKSNIRSAREKGTDIVVVYLHFGDEYEHKPSKYQKDIVNKTIQSGADIIIGGHTHVLQPVEFYKTNGARLDSGFVIYSMGNFISNQRWRYSDGGAIINFSLTKDVNRDSIYLNDVSYLPIWVFKGMTRSGKKYIIIPSEAAFTDSVYYFLTPEDRKIAGRSFHDTKECILRYSSKPRLREIFKETIYDTKHLSFE